MAHSLARYDGSRWRRRLPPLVYVRARSWPRSEGAQGCQSASISCRPRRVCPDSCARRRETSENTGDTKGHMTALNPTFAKLGVRDEIVRALAESGIEHPFAIQELTLPLALAGDDLIGQARTGMGKTLAFGVPLLHRIAGDPDRPLTGVPRALVVVPTR